MGILVVSLIACAPATPQVTPQVVSVYATPATQPWLPDLADCVGKSSAILRSVERPADADIALRIGQPADLSQPAFQIDTEDILVVTHRESPVQNLNLEQVKTIFSGVSGMDLEIWEYAPGQDIQQVFETEVMQGIPVTSQARLATSPQQMSDVLNSDKNAVGILPRHWKAGTVRDVYTYSGVPVLAIVASEPRGIIKDILACLQK